MSTQQTYSPKQKIVFKNAHRRWNILSGAVRSGKTFCSYDLIPLRIKGLPHGNRLLIGKTLATLQRNVLDPLRERYHYVSSVSNRGVVRIFDRPFYCVGANDEKSVAKIQGLGLIYAYGDEVTTWPESFFQMLKSRLDKPGACFDGTCNPESPQHWFKQSMIDNPDLDVFHQHFTLDDNPFLSEEFKNNLKKEYTGVWYRRYILGEWCMAEGVIYDCFNEAIHVIDDLPPGRYAYYAGVDYGTSNPTVFLLLAHDLITNNLYIIDEYYYDSRVHHRQKTDAEYSQDYIKFIEGRYPQETFVDPSAASFILQLRKDGVNGVRQANNAVLDGIRTVASAYHQGKLFILRRCNHLINEIPCYVWDSEAQKIGEDRPLKQNDHCSDAKRYILNTKFKYLFNRALNLAF